MKSNWAIHFTKQELNPARKAVKLKWYLVLRFLRYNALLQFRTAVAQNSFILTLRVIQAENFDRKSTSSCSSLVTQLSDPIRTNLNRNFSRKGNRFRNLTSKEYLKSVDLSSSPLVNKQTRYEHCHCLRNLQLTKVRTTETLLGMRWHTSARLTGRYSR